MFIFVSVIWITYGQTIKSIDSINLSLQEAKIDTVKIAILNDAAWDYRYKDSIGRVFAMQSLDLSKKIQYDNGHATSLVRLAAIEMFAGNYDKAEEYALEALQIELRNKDPKRIFRAKFQLTNIYNKSKQLDKAFLYAEESLSLAEEMKNSAYKAKVYSVLGDISSTQKEFKEALVYYEESIKIRKKLGRELELAKSYLNIGEILRSLKKYDEELIYLQKGTVLSKLSNDEKLLSKFYNNLGINYEKRKKKDSAVIFYKLSLDLKEKINDNFKDAIYNNLGYIYKDKGEFEISKDYFLKSLAISRQYNRQGQEAKTLYNLGNLFLREKKYQKAIDYLNQSRVLSRKNGDKNLELSILMSLGESHERKGDLKKSILYNEDHIVLRDSLDEIYRQANLVIKNYEKLKQEEAIKDQKLLTLKANEETQEVKFFAVSVLLIIISILFFVILKFRKEKREKEIIAQNNIELLKKQELKSIKAMIDGQEKERKRIAQDLHDRLGSMLSMVKLHYKSVEDSLDKLKQENKDQYEKASILLDEACEAVREIAHAMISGVLTKFGLAAALEELKDTIESSNTLDVELITYGLDDRLDNKIEMEVYGIIQELIHNVIKHAKAKELSIQLLKKEETLQVIVEDDGIGFDILNTGQNEGMGLKSVYSRVDDLFGEIAIDSGKGKGTTITIQIPLED